MRLKQLIFHNKINLYKGDKGIMKMTNFEIYTTFAKINSNFTGDEVLPIKLNFYFQKNNKILMELAKEIEESRMEIGKKYGEATEDGYTIPAEKIDEANKEYEELMTLEQEVNICTISIEKLPDDLELTTAQVDALSYMIVE